MKKWLIFLFTLLLALPAAAGTADGPLASFALLDGVPVEADLDGDGAMEELTFRTFPDEEASEDSAEVAVSDGEASGLWQSGLLYAADAYIADLDGDGVIEILVCGDEMSADYETWCLHWVDGGLAALPFADASRSGTGEGYADVGYGYVYAIDGGSVTLCGSQDVLGTYFGTRVFTLTDGVFELDDDGLWHFIIDEYAWDRALLPTQDIAATFVADGVQTEGAIPAGTRFIVTASDKVSVVWFETEDGREGFFAIAPDTEAGWGSLVNGIPEGRLFETVPYAD